MEKNSILTPNEKMAYQVLGETDAKTFFMNGKSGKDILKQDAISKFNDMVDKYQEKFNDYTVKVEEFADRVAKNAESIEVMPIGNYLLIKVFDENPFQRITVSDSGLITDLGGMAPTYKNTDNGNYEEEEQFIKVGVVQEVGPECKYCKPGDTIMYPKTREVVVPFYKLGYRIVNETGVIVVINEGLKERFYNE